VPPGAGAKLLDDLLVERVTAWEGSSHCLQNVLEVLVGGTPRELVTLNQS
jgi:hypothetical protein